MPIVMELAATDDHMLWALMRDSFLEMATSTFVTPWPILSRMTYLTKSRDRSMPMPGVTRFCQS